jgi:hypothetical protein
MFYHLKEKELLYLFYLKKQFSISVCKVNDLLLNKNGKAEKNYE